MMVYGYTVKATKRITPRITGVDSKTPSPKLSLAMGLKIIKGKG
jgi:hypothetical protein